MLSALADRKPKAVRLHAGLKDTPHRAVALAAAELPPKKRPDAVDALVALTAARHGSAVAFTSDPAGLTACLKALDAQDVHVVRI
ncbi:hypothetical protein ACFQ2M_23560 [Kitasatospora saccharophila]|uniref:hypothetical protein n=1 Tax=Kitasatospora saccharophila TaxID=407973 RepID=UPI0031DEE119